MRYYMTNKRFCAQTIAHDRRHLVVLFPQPYRAGETVRREAERFPARFRRPSSSPAAVPASEREGDGGIDVRISIG
jgi:hypothetical protein